MGSISGKTIERLSMYRRLLTRQLIANKDNIYSHELADLAQITSAQVRRDLMILKLSGNSRKGYNVRDLIAEISTLLGVDAEQKIILLGVGNLGRAILSYFNGKKSDLKMVAAFDVDSERVGRVISGCHCQGIDQLKKFMSENKIEMAILTVPANEAQELTDMLVDFGIKSIVNFTHWPLKVPSTVYVENIDITLGVEKAAYFSQNIQ